MTPWLISHLYAKLGVSELLLISVYAPRKSADSEERNAEISCVGTRVCCVCVRLRAALDP